MSRKLVSVVSCAMVLVLLTLLLASGRNVEVHVAEDANTPTESTTTTATEASLSHQQRGAPDATMVVEATPVAVDSTAGSAQTAVGKEDAKDAQILSGLTDNVAFATSLEGTGRTVPFASGPCHCLPPSITTDGSWSTEGTWQAAPDTELRDGPFVTVKRATEAILEGRLGTLTETTTKVRILMIGDSITRYLMCFLTKSIAKELAVEGLQGCEPETSRGTHFLIWPSPEFRNVTPIILQFVSDFYFPESHVAQDLSLVESQEVSWMGTEPDVIITSRGTWDAWIRMPRASAGRHLYYGYTAGLQYLRSRYPHAEMLVYGLSYQYPARFHKHSERCAMQTSQLQVRSLVYCAVREANAWVTQQASDASRVRYLDFFPMTYADKQWSANTMNGDGMHYVGPHEAWFAKYVWRLLFIAFRSRSDPSNVDLKSWLQRSTPSPMPSLPTSTERCEEDSLALNTMPHQKRLRNPPKARGSKVKRDCGLWLADRQALLDFHKSFHRLKWKNVTRAIAYSDCVFYHKASAQRLGGVDRHWPSPFTDSLGGSGTVAVRPLQRPHIDALRNLTRTIHTLRTPLWDRWQRNSQYCLGVERRMSALDIAEMRKHIEAGIVPCGHLVVFTLRASDETRKFLELPTILEQRCNIVRKNRDL